MSTHERFAQSSVNYSIIFIFFLLPGNNSIQIRVVTIIYNKEISTQEFSPSSAIFDSSRLAISELTFF